MKAFWLFFLLILASCGFLPSGEKVLSKRIKNQEISKFENYEESNFDIAQGRPIFIEALTYPQYMDGGHVSLEGKLGIMLGREAIKIQDLISLPRNNQDLKDEFDDLTKNETK